MAAGLGSGHRRPVRMCRRAHRCLRVDLQADLGSRTGPGLSLHQLAPMAYPCSIRGSCHRGPAPRRSTCPLGWVEEIGRQLSERSSATASAVTGSLSEDVLARLLLSDPLADPTRLLEAALSLDGHRGARQPEVRAPQARRCDVGRNMGATCRSELPPTSRRISANIATLDGSHASLRLR